MVGAWLWQTGKEQKAAGERVAECAAVAAAAVQVVLQVGWAAGVDAAGESGDAGSDWEGTRIAAW